MAAYSGRLKTAYREQVDNLYCGGADTVGRQHFTLLYSRAREVALTRRNIKSGWAKTGLYPFNPDRVLRDIQKPPAKPEPDAIERVQIDVPSPHDLLPTPVTAESLSSLCRKIEQENRHLDVAGKHRLQKLANAAQKFITGCALLGEENRLLVNQNNEKITRLSAKFTVVGTARIMSYDDILEAQRKREAQESNNASRPGRGRKRRASASSRAGEKRSQLIEIEKGNQEIDALGLREYCSVLEL